MWKSGDKLTINGTIISESGFIRFNDGDKLIIEEVFYTKGHYHSQLPDLYIKPELSHFKLVGESGHWLPNLFKETKIKK